MQSVALSGLWLEEKMQPVALPGFWFTTPSLRQASAASVVCTEQRIQHQLLTPCCRFGPRNLVPYLGRHRELYTFISTFSSCIKDYNGALRAFSGPVIYLVASK